MKEFLQYLPEVFGFPGAGLERDELFRVRKYRRRNAVLSERTRATPARFRVTRHHQFVPKCCRLYNGPKSEEVDTGRCHDDILLPAWSVGPARKPVAPAKRSPLVSSRASDSVRHPAAPRLSGVVFAA
ncbi:hypothetical protein ACGFMK_39905 [Amycolatopsis sp. NPDC049252]|uniref:hypothetical protein n=1 Tax=Amycolatopsis sp. NPDC049252 TaxID=3363933 RepID=UPI00371AC701